MNQTIVEYFEALDRLIAGEPRILTKDATITNDAVALEAGRGKGSIKKSRPIFADLIVAIDRAAQDRANTRNSERANIRKLNDTMKSYRAKWEDAIAREICLLFEVYELKQRLRTLDGGSVLPIRPSARP